MMAGDFQDSNPYSTPQHGGKPGPESLREAVKGKVMAPAVCLIIVGALGLVMSIFSVFMAMFVEPVPPDPNAPEWMQQISQGSSGPFAAVIQAGFIILNILILVGAAQMMRFKSWGFALAACILAMVNIGNCCCIIGLPAGIWGVVVLLSENVKAAFAASSN